MLSLARYTGVTSVVYINWLDNKNAPVEALRNALAFIGGLVKLEKHAIRLMLLLDVVGEAQMWKVELPRLSAQVEKEKMQKLMQREKRRCAK